MILLDSGQEKALKFCMPIRIYLDTQDYYKLYKNRSLEAQEIYEFLVSKVNSKEIEIGFSYPLISEFLQDYEPKFKNDRIERSKLIKELCGKKCFRYIEKLNKEEPFSYNGDWTPLSGKILDLDDLKNKCTKTIIEQLPPLNRKQSNALKNKRGLKRLIKENRHLFYNKIKTDEIQIPVTEKFIKENMIMKYISGELPRHIVEAEFLSCITDLELFIVAWHEHGEKDNFLYNNVKKPGKGLIETIKKLDTAIQSAKDVRKTIRDFEKGVHRANLEDVFKDHLAEAKKNKPKVPRIDKKFIKELISDNKIINFFPESFWDSVVCYMNHRVKNIDAIKDSDVVDLLHSVYLPYCDLWRGDKDFSNLLIKGDIKGKEKIVSKLSDLPKRISNILN